MRRADLPDDPLALFRGWDAEARAAGVPEPDAAALATADSGGRPSCRMVLVRGVDARGFAFYTSYESRKGEELRANPAAALLWWWPVLGRQVRVEGAVEVLPAAESDAYFAGRPRESQISAAASPQSRAIDDRAALVRLTDALAAQTAGGPVRRPAWWGGFRLAPSAVEFWQNGEHRRHDRFRYEVGAGGWTVARLAP